MEIIFNLLDENINKYKPDIAICMMGINNINGFSFFNLKKFTNLHIVKLFYLLKEHLYSIFISNQNNIENLENNALQLFHKQDYKNAEILFKQILQKEPHRELSFFCLFFIYKHYFDTNYRKIAYNMAIDGINNNISIGRSDYYTEILEFITDKEQRDYYINKIIEDKFLYTPFLLYRQLISITDNPHIKQALLDKIASTNNDKINYFLAIDSLEQHNYKEAEKYFDIIENERLNNPNIETYNLYKLIIKKLIDNNIKVICMHYPVRSILSLQKQLKNEPYYNKLTFISNEKLFKDALMKKNYNEIFNDQFAGDFEHCTDLGNTMIAENIIETLENLLDLKK